MTWLQNGIVLLAFPSAVRVTRVVWCLEGWILNSKVEFTANLHGKAVGMMHFVTGSPLPPVASYLPLL